MKIVLRSSKGNKAEESDITNFCNSIQWSGDKSQIARKFELAMVVPVHDKNQPIISAALGDSIQVFEGDVEIFRGIIFSREKSISSQQVRVVAYDHLYYLINNYATYNFKNMSPEQIAQKVCSDFGISTGSFAGGGRSINLIVKGESLIKIILKAYDEVTKTTKKEYYPIELEGKVSIIEKGAKVIDYLIDANTNVIDANYGESIESMVNKVKVYDEKGNLVDTESKDEWINKYGMLQQIYEKTGENGNYIDVARNMLKDMQQTIQITVKGNIYYKTGYAVEVREPYTGLIGVFDVDSDSHTWNNCIHQTQLSLTLRKMKE